MTSQKLIAPSILSADFGKLAQEIIDVTEAGADWIHVDVMDGHFVPNITIGPLIVKAVRKATKNLIDVHLMIENPDQYISAFAEAGADAISVHYEEGYHLDRTLRLIKEKGLKVGVAINPATPVEAIYSVLSLVDFVLVMTVNPGFGGQSFIEYCLQKIKTLKEKIQSEKLNVLIQVDGGIKESNIGRVSEAGADVFVAGSAVFESANYAETISVLKSRAGSV